MSSYDYTKENYKDPKGFRGKLDLVLLRASHINYIKPNGEAAEAYVFDFRVLDGDFADMDCGAFVPDSRRAMHPVLEAFGWNIQDATVEVDATMFDVGACVNGATCSWDANRTKFKVVGWPDRASDSQRFQGTPPGGSGATEEEDTPF